jgi:hypothetical protein
MSFNEDILLYKHVELVHHEEIPENMTVKQFCFNKRRGKDYQLCQICKTNHTDWNEKTGRYNPICNDPVCHKKMRDKFLSNYKNKNGKDHDASDPDYQKKMLHNRKTSGLYEFKDGKKVPYASKYERDFLEFWERDLKLQSSTIDECSIYFHYMWEGKKRMYIPDYYSPDFNLIIEIKASDNKHPKILAVDKQTELLKDKAVIDSKSYNYIKIMDMNYEDLTELIKVLRARQLNEKIEDDDLFIIIPKDTRPVKDFKMPKLDFLTNKDEFKHEYIMNYYNSLTDINFSLILDKKTIPSEYIVDELLPTEYTVLRSSQLDKIDNYSKLNQIFKEFTVYYTKSYEKYIDQEFMSIYHKIDTSYYSVISLTRDNKYLDKVISAIIKPNKGKKLKYITVNTKLGYQVLVDTNQKYLSSLLYPHGIKNPFFTNYLAVPGTKMANYEIHITEEYSDWENK